jgi:hypothetical protein
VSAPQASRIAVLSGMQRARRLLRGRPVWADVRLFGGVPEPV